MVEDSELGVLIMLGGLPACYSTLSMRTGEHARHPELAELS